MSIERRIREDLEVAVEIVSRLEGVRRRGRLPRVALDPALRDDAELDVEASELRVRPRVLERDPQYRRTILHEAAHLVLPEATERECEGIARDAARMIERGEITVDDEDPDDGGR